MGADGADAAGQSFTQRAEQAARLGCGLLGWTPETFWSATPAELRTAVLGRLGRFADAEAGAPGLTCAEMAKLMERYPDGR